MRADDALKYAAALLKATADWTGDEISGSECGGGHEVALDAVDDRVRTVVDLAAEFGNPLIYSDGRVVKSRKTIDGGLITEHIWHPDPTVEKPSSWRGYLLSDPGIPSPGVYEVETDPSTQTIHVRVVRGA